MVTLAGRSCVARQEPYIPGALSILPGTVPGQVRGLGHMVPTYFRRELRDRALQRRWRLRTLSFEHRRYGRACPGHPRLYSARESKTRMPGMTPGMTVADVQSSRFTRPAKSNPPRYRAGSARCVER